MRRFNRFLLLIFTLISAICLLSCSETTVKSATKAKPSKPNFLVIMLDDLGYSDIGAYGGEIDTPNIDALAFSGVRYTEFFNSSRCSPTRANLLTGQYAHRVNMGKNGGSINFKGATIAEILGANGYQTVMAGKWHLTKASPIKNKEEHLKWLSHRGHFDKNFGDLESYPINRGFQKHYGPIWGVVNFFDPFSLVDGETPIKEVADDYYITDALSDKTSEYIREFSKNEKPFFIYLAHTAPHWPLHAKESDIKKYRGKYDSGWQPVRKARYQKQLELGLIDPERIPYTRAFGRDNRDPWDNYSAKEKRYHAEKFAVHAAMVDSVDQGVGKIIQTLKETGQYENTVIMVLSDNGASPERPSTPGYDRPGHTRDGKQINYGDSDLDVLPGSGQTFTGLGAMWANAANTPWRFWKKESFDGGIHTPMIVSWPEGIKAKGSINASLGHAMDIAPTIYDIANIDYPEKYKQHKLNAMDGRSFVASFNGKELARGPLYFEHMGGRAIIDGQYKLVSTVPRKKREFKEWQLFDLKNDRIESKNIIKEKPEVAKHLAASWDDWFDDVLKGIVWYGELK